MRREAGSESMNRHFCSSAARSPGATCCDSCNGRSRTLPFFMQSSGHGQPLPGRAMPQPSRCRLHPALHLFGNFQGWRIAVHRARRNDCRWTEPSDLLIIAPEFLAASFNRYHFPAIEQINFPHFAREGANIFRKSSRQNGGSTGSGSCAGASQAREARRNVGSGSSLTARQSSISPRKTSDGLKRLRVTLMSHSHVRIRFELS